jgi:3'-phosphoadenosine 5'-phosphosulfate sulfotransferase (PAPS reductase)/FAD synthetase
MAKRKVTAANGTVESKEATIKHVEIKALEAWLKTLTDDSIDINERLGRVKIAIAWTLGKDSQVAKDVMTKFGL